MNVLLDEASAVSVADGAGDDAPAAVHAEDEVSCDAHDGHDGHGRLGARQLRDAWQGHVRALRAFFLCSLIFLNFQI